MRPDVVVDPPRARRARRTTSRSGSARASSTRATARTSTRRRRCSTRSPSAARKGTLDGLVVDDLRRHRALAASRARTRCLLAHFGAEVRVVGPRTLLPRGASRRSACARLDRLEPALEGADVVMVLRIQRERLEGALLPTLREYSRTFGDRARAARGREAGRDRDAPRADEPRRRDRPERSPTGRAASSSIRSRRASPCAWRCSTCSRASSAAAGRAPRPRERASRRDRARSDRGRRRGGAPMRCAGGASGSSRTRRASTARFVHARRRARRAPACESRALFGPEHGYGGEAQDMIGVGDARDAGTGAPIHSLYGATRGDARAARRAARRARRGRRSICRTSGAATTRSSGPRCSCCARRPRARRARRSCSTGRTRSAARSIEGAPQRDGLPIVRRALRRRPSGTAMTIGEIARWCARSRALDDASAARRRRCAGWDRAMTFERDRAAVGAAVAEHADAATPRSSIPGGCLLEGTEPERGPRHDAPVRDLSARRSIDGRALAAELPRLAASRLRPLTFRPTFHKHAGARRAAACRCTSPTRAQRGASRSTRGCSPRSGGARARRSRGAARPTSSCGTGSAIDFCSRAGRSCARPWSAATSRPGAARRTPARPGSARRARAGSSINRVDAGRFRAETRLRCAAVDEPRLQLRWQQAWRRGRGRRSSRGATGSSGGSGAAGRAACSWCATRRTAARCARRRSSRPRRSGGCAGSSRCSPASRTRTSRACASVTIAAPLGEPLRLRAGVGALIEEARGGQAGARGGGGAPRARPGAARRLDARCRRGGGARVAAVHAAGLVHGDVKPSNLVAREDDGGAVKLVDLGLARPTGSFAAEVSGTPGYLAPEAWLGERTVAGDLYALGVTIAELLRGGERADGETRSRSAAELLGRALSRRPPSSTLGAEVPAALGRLLDALVSSGILRSGRAPRARSRRGSRRSRRATARARRAGRAAGSRTRRRRRSARSTRRRCRSRATRRRCARSRRGSARRA